MADTDLGISVSIDANLDRLTRAMQEAGRVVEASTSGMDRATKRAAEAFNRAEAKAMPYSKALRTIERDVENVRLAMDKGAVTAERAAPVIQRLTDRYEHFAAKAKGAAAAADASGGRFRNMGTVVQQAGFQIGDLATQLASGQSAMVAVTQQGTQLVSMFGPWGAAVGAAGAIVGALAVHLWDTDEAAKDAAKAIKTHSEAIQEAEDFIKRLNHETADRTTLLREERNEVLKNARVEVDAAQTRLDAMLAEVQARNAFMMDANADPMVGTFIDYRAIQQQEEALKKASAAFEELRKRIDGAVEGNVAFKEAEEKAKRAVEDHTSAVDDLLQGYRDELDLIGLSEREQAMATATRQAQTAALDDFNAGLRDTPLLYQAELDAIRQSVGALQDHRAELARQSDAQKQAEREMRRYTEEMGRDACEYPDDVLEDPALAGMVKEALQ